MSWAAQQLAEFLDDVARAEDAAEAARRGVERAAEAVSAECAALLRGGVLVASIGWPRLDIPERELRAGAAAVPPALPVPGSGEGPAVALTLEDDDAQLVVVRAGEPLTREDET